MVNQFHGIFNSKTPSCHGCRKIKSVFMDVKWYFNASLGPKGLIYYVWRRDLNVFTSIIWVHHFIYGKTYCLTIYWYLFLQNRVVAPIPLQDTTEPVGLLYIMGELELIYLIRSMHDQDLLIPHTFYHITTISRKFLYCMSIFIKTSWSCYERYYCPNYHICCIISCCNSVPNNLWCLVHDTLGPIAFNCQD